MAWTTSARADWAGSFARRSTRGNVVEDFLTRLRARSSFRPGEAPLSQRQAAKVLCRRRLLDRGGRVPARAREGRGRQRSRGTQPAGPPLPGRASTAKRRPSHLERAWKVTQAALAAGKVDRAEKDEAIRRAVELTPKIREALGRAWLEESFTQRPERGMEIIAAIGCGTRRRACRPSPSTPTSGSNRSRCKSWPSRRCSDKGPPARQEWSSSLALLAEAWLREAEFSYHYDFSTSLGPRMQYDPYGNVYYSNYDPFSPEMMARQRGMPMAVQGRRPRQGTARRRLGRLRRPRDQTQVCHGLRQALPEGQRGGRGVSLHRAARDAPTPARPRSWRRSSSGSGPRTTTPTRSSCAAAGSSTSTGLTIGPRVFR